MLMRDANRGSCLPAPRDESPKFRFYSKLAQDATPLSNNQTSSGRELWRGDTGCNTFYTSDFRSIGQLGLKLGSSQRDCQSGASATTRGVIRRGRRRLKSTTGL